MEPRPLYTPANCSNSAYQLNWSYTIFWHSRPTDFSWLDELKTMNEKDHIRILQHEFKDSNMSQFLISTRPTVIPLIVAQRIKGRLQRILCDSVPNAFQRNYSLRSIGSTKREKLEKYIAGQVAHHPMGDSAVQDRLDDYQIRNLDVDLSLPQRTAHAQYWHNLHIVLANDGRYMEIRHELMDRLREMIVKVSKSKGHRLSRAGILPDHIHITLGCSLDESPENVVLCYMNNLAYACGMKPVFQYSYFVGTTGDYDLGVIPRPVVQNPALHRASSVGA